MKVLKFFVNRAMLTVLLLVVQFVFLVLSVYFLTEYFWHYYFLLEALSILCAMYVLNKDMDPTIKLPWIIIIIVIPPFGMFIYALFHSNNPRKKLLKVSKGFSKNIKFEHTTSSAVQTRLRKGDSRAVAQSNYLEKSNDNPTYAFTKTKYFSSGESFFKEYICQLKKAKKFIFMEYFILQGGKMWDEIFTVLKHKAEQGIEVKVMYDDIGSIYKLPYNFPKKMAKHGIEVVKFNRFRPIISALHNNRDHRKITIIDGKVAFTGGINIADEYINAKKVYGHWKDSALMLEGKAVDTMTYEFLKISHMNGNGLANTEKYFPIHEQFENERGFVHPFFDGPSAIYGNNVGENAFINTINQAKDYLYITTPYLIVDYNFISALKLAAKRGVDVKIITPHIPDKKIIFLQTRASYKTLLEAGVQIFEYVPGFMHAKTMVSDDKFAIVGTFNIDYRSFVHHFENGVWLYKTPSIKDIKNDVTDTLKLCKEIKIGNYNFGFFKRVLSSLISIFSPLM